MHLWHLWRECNSVSNRDGPEPRTTRLVRIHPTADAALLGIHRGSLSAAKTWLCCHGLLELPAWRDRQIVIPAEQHTRRAAHPHAQAVRASSWVRAPLTHLFAGDAIAYLGAQRPQRTATPDTLPYAKPSTAMMHEPRSGRVRRVLLNMPAPSTDRRTFTQFRRGLIARFPWYVPQDQRHSGPRCSCWQLLCLASWAITALGWWSWNPLRQPPPVDDRRQPGVVGWRHSSAWVSSVPSPAMRIGSTTRWSGVATVWIWAPFHRIYMLPPTITPEAYAGGRRL
jgi:hypothetical protein